MSTVEQFKQELSVMALGPLFTDTDIIDLSTGEIIAHAGTDISDEDLDRVLHLVLEDAHSVYTIIDNGIYLAHGYSLPSAEEAK